MNEIIDAIIIGLPYAAIVLSSVCIALLYGIVGAWLVSTNYKVVTVLYFVLIAIIGFIFLSYIFGMGV